MPIKATVASRMNGVEKIENSTLAVSPETSRAVGLQTSNPINPATLSTDHNTGQKYCREGVIREVGEGSIFKLPTTYTETLV